MGIIRDITQRKITEEQVRQLAFYDDLTKLPNRRLLIDRLSQAMSSGKRSGLYSALIFLDLDNFKPLNDRHGHVVGDQLLMEAAGRLASCVRESDTVARFGGDEFVVLLNGLSEDKTTSTSQGGIVAEKVRACLSANYFLSDARGGHSALSIEHHCTASIGVVIFGNDATTPHDVLKWADAAMYEAKRSGRNSIRFIEAAGAIAQA
jgi:diguanylate cyclase (GGDEF)-like protein